MKPTSKSKPELYCFINGKIMPLAKAALPITDIAIGRGYAAFDSMLAIGDRVFHLDDHVQRFFASAKMARIVIPYTKEEIATAILKVLRKNNLAQSKVRMIMTGGTQIRSLEFDTAHGNFMIIAEPFVEHTPNVYEKGVSLITAEYKRPLASAKTTNYMIAVSMQEERQKRKAFEILYTYKGNIYECSTSNFFVVKGKQLITADKEILRGIIRAFVLDSAPKIGLKVVERAVTWKDITSADEAFISGSYKGVIPVIKIDDTIIGNGKVGHAAESLQEMYREFHT